MKRIGALVKFKPGVTQEQAEAALAKIRDVLDVPETFTDYNQKPTSVTLEDKSIRFDFPTRPYMMADLVNEFDDKYGGPVWYVP